MHVSEMFIPDWVEYSCFDAEILFFLRETLSLQLSQMKTDEENMGDNLVLYMKYWRPFGELLTDMERTGFKIDADYLRKCELQAVKDQEEHLQKFLNWVKSTQEDADDFNASSIPQLQHLLFAPFNKKSSAKSQEDKQPASFDDKTGDASN